MGELGWGKRLPKIKTEGETGRKTQRTRDHVRKNQKEHQRHSYRENGKTQSLRDGDQCVCAGVGRGDMTHAERELKV